ncbi:MAG: queuosine precursor transporter [Legionellales bacterium]|nr:queuosine precursor transporter [Legionellales bacterium]
MIFKFLNKLFNAIKSEKNNRDSTYRIAGIVENYEETGKVYAKINTRGTSKVFDKKISTLYEKKWLDGFNKEDVAYISFLYAAEETKQLPLIEFFPRKKQRVTRSVLGLGMLFITFLILSNLTAIKVSQISIFGSTITFPAALIFFPITYFFDDILTEVYGFQVSRLIIWGGLVCNTIFTFLTWVSVYLPASTVWSESTHHAETAYKLVFSGSPRIFFASAIAYFFGEFLNSTILAKLKILTSGKYFFLRVIGSTAVGVGIDSSLFCSIAFFNILPVSMIIDLILTQYIFKLFYEIVMIPFTYLLSALLKKVDNVNYYDFETKFNPFSLDLND